MFNSLPKSKSYAQNLLILSYYNVILEGNCTGIHGINVIARDGMHCELRLGDHFGPPVPLQHILSERNLNKVREYNSNWK
jgi:hypothetical protein